MVDGRWTDKGERPIVAEFKTEHVIDLPCAGEQHVLDEMHLHFGRNLMKFRFGDKRRGFRFDIDGEQAPVFEQFIGGQCTFRNGKIVEIGALRCVNSRESRTFEEGGFQINEPMAVLMIGLRLRFRVVP